MALCNLNCNPPKLAYQSDLSIWKIWTLLMLQRFYCALKISITRKYNRTNGSRNPPLEFTLRFAPSDDYWKNSLEQVNKSSFFVFSSLDMTVQICVAIKPSFEFPLSLSLSLFIRSFFELRPQGIITSAHLCINSWVAWQHLCCRLGKHLRWSNRIGIVWPHQVGI